MDKAGFDDMRALELCGISKSYGRGNNAKHAVSDVSLTVRRGEVYGFLGPNGAGKSTTIRMVLGLITPSSGRIKLFGRDVKEHRALDRVGSLVDGGAFYPFLSGLENLRILARTRGISDPPVERLLERVDLSRDAHVKVKDHSLGMRQRLGVAAALLNDPDLVILDEPANGLDAAGIQDMRMLIRGLADEGKAVFLSSHLLHEVEQVCHRVAIVAKGKLLQEASIGDMLTQEEAIQIHAEPADVALRVVGAQWAAVADGPAMRIRARREETPAIVKRLVENGVAVHRVGSHRESLEDIFLNMTRDEDA